MENLIIIIIVIKKTLRGKDTQLNIITPVQQGNLQNQLHVISKYSYQWQKRLMHN